MAQTDGPNTFRPTTAWRALRRILRTYPCIERAAAPREGSKTAQSSRRCCGPRRHNFRDHADYELAHRRWPAEWLVAIWNSLPGVTPAKKFKDRTTAATRIWKNIQGLGESVKPNPAQPVQLKAARKALSRNNYRFMFVMPLQRERHLYSPAVVRGEKIGADKEQNDLC